MTSNRSISAHVLLVFACLAWGGSYAVGRFGLSEGSALWLTLWRWGPGAVLFAVYVIFTDQPMSQGAEAFLDWLRAENDRSERRA